MPKLYEYLGINVYFYAGDHPPIHVHGVYQGYQSKAEILIENDKITGIRFVRVKGDRPLPLQKQNDFEELIEHEAENIVRMWIDFRQNGIPPKAKRITRRIR